MCKFCPVLQPIRDQFAEICKGNLFYLEVCIFVNKMEKIYELFRLAIYSRNLKFQKIEDFIYQCSILIGIIPSPSADAYLTDPQYQIETHL